MGALIDSLGGDAGLTIKEQDGSPTGTATTIKVPNGQLVDDGSNVVSVNLTTSGTTLAGTDLATFNGNLVHAYLFGSPTGGRIRDVIGTADLHSYRIGAPTYGVTGKSGDAVKLINDSAFKAGATGLAPAVGASFTVSVWVNLAATGLFDRWLAWQASESSSANRKGLDNSDGGVVRMVGDAAVLITGGSLSTATWKHVVWTRDTSGTDVFELWLDGVSQGTSTTDAGDDLSALEFYVGRQVDTGAVNVSLQHLYIWDTVISNDAIADLYNSGTGAFL